MKAKSVRAWAVVDPKGRVLVTSLARTRKDCLALWAEDGNESWRYCEKEGYRCVRVTVTVEDGE